MKLLFFAATLAILPISSYFLTEKYVWSGTSRLYCRMQQSRVPVLIFSSLRQFQLCCNHRHMCSQCSPHRLHRRFFDGRQAIVQGSGGEETVRNQEGAIKPIITVILRLSFVVWALSMHAFFLFISALCKGVRSNKLLRSRLRLIVGYKLLKVQGPCSVFQLGIYDTTSFKS